MPLLRKSKELLRNCNKRPKPNSMLKPSWLLSNKPRLLLCRELQLRSLKDKLLRLGSKSRPRLDKSLRNKLPRFQLKRLNQEPRLFKRRPIRSKLCRNCKRSMLPRSRPSQPWLRVKP